VPKSFSSGVALQIVINKLLLVVIVIDRKGRILPGNQMAELFAAASHSHHIGMSPCEYFGLFKWEA
jgi:hypothetical protein